MPLEFVISLKDKQFLLLNGCLHNIHQKYDAKIVWRCTEYKKFFRKGRCHTTIRYYNIIFNLTQLIIIYKCNVRNNVM